MSESRAEVQEAGCYVALTHGLLQVSEIMDRVRSPEAGAIVLFAGTTRDNFDGKPVKELQYSAYSPLALRTMMAIAREVRKRHSLRGIAMVHRLGVVPIGEESILIAVSAPHRKAAWLAGEEALEEVKSRVEVWKQEMFHGRDGVWRANRDGISGEKVAGSDESKGTADESAEEKEREARRITEQLRGPDANAAGDEGVPETMVPTLRPSRPGEKGHGAVVNSKPGPAPE